MSESRVLEGDAYIKSKQIVGTPLSLSPEVVKGEGYDQRSDIWGLGVALYQLATLQPPFLEPDMPALFHAIQYKQPKAIPHYSSTFTEFVGMCLQKKKEDRPTITELLSKMQSKDMPGFNLKLMSPLDEQNF